MNTNSTIPPNNKEIKNMLILQDYLKIKNYFSLYWIRVFSNLL